jgi:hypothetical protein
MGELLGGLEPLELQKEKLCPQLEEIPVETQLLTLADISLERETGVLRDVLQAMKKL